MKKLILLIVPLFCSMFVSAQLKVFSTGQTLLGSTDDSVTGNVQFNLALGANNGITFKNPQFGQIYRYTMDEYCWALTNGQNNTKFGFYEQGFYFGHNYYTGNYGAATVNIMPIWQNTNYGTCALYVGSPFNDGSANILSRNTSTSSGGVSIASIVKHNSGIAFASAKSSLMSNFTYSFYVYGNGDTYAHGLYTTSDSTKKTNIRDLQTPLDKILRLHGVEFQFISDLDEPDSSEDISTSLYNSQKDTLRRSSSTLHDIQLPTIDSSTLNLIEQEKNNGKHFGFLAQEVERVVPEVVRTSIDGTKSISYLEIIALLVEGIKEQQQKIEQLQADVMELQIDNSLKVNKASHKKDNVDFVSEAILYQNIPNPFDNNTSIQYSLPASVQDAAIFIYDMNGEQLARFAINPSSERLVINGSSLQAGMYLYSLIADGRVIDTKRMILTK